MGDNRTYKICVRVVDARMVWGPHLPYEQRVSRRTINEVAGISGLWYIKQAACYYRVGVKWGKSRIPNGFLF